MKCPNTGVPSPGTSEPNIAAMAGVCSALEAGALSGGKKPEGSSRPAVVPGKLPVQMTPDGEG